MFADMRLSDFVKQAASDAPTPGGGAIAALSGSLGASMAAMAASFTVGRPKFVDVEAEAGRILGLTRSLADSLLGGVDADADAFAAIGGAYKLPKEDEGEKKVRREAIDKALTSAMAVPGAVLDDCLAAAELLPGLAAIANPNLLSDVEVAAVMLEAAGRAARLNILANACQLRNEEAARATARADATAGRLAGLLAETLAVAAKRK